MDLTEMVITRMATTFTVMTKKVMTKIITMLMGTIAIVMTTRMRMTTKPPLSYIQAYMVMLVATNIGDDPALLVLLMV